MATTIFSNTLIKPSTGSTRPLRILGIAGSLRYGSYNRAALRAAAELLPPDTELDIFDLAGIPVFNQDDENRLPDAVAEMKQHIRAADALSFQLPNTMLPFPEFSRTLLTGDLVPRVTTPGRASPLPSWELLREAWEQCVHSTICARYLFT